MSHFTYEEQSVGVIYGFLRQLFSLSKKLGTSQFVFVWDSRKSYRKKIFPGYKAGRAAQIRNKPEIDQLNQIAYPQFDTLRTRIIPKMGFVNNFIQSGVEADDLIATIVTNNPNQDRNLIVSSDTDLYQLLSPNVALCKPGAKFQVYTAKHFEKEYQIPPQEWAKVKAIAGCKTDSIPGISGVGEKTAVKYLQGVLPTTTKAYQSIHSVEGQNVIGFNAQLVQLPFPKTKQITLNWNQELHAIDFIEILEEFGMKSILRSDVLDLWISQFRMR